MSNKKRILFIGRYTSPDVLKSLHFRSWKVDDIIRSMFGRPKFYFPNVPVWYMDYVDQFRKHPEYEYHIVAPFKQLKHNIEEYTDSTGIHFHFYRLDSNYIVETYKKITNSDERNDYERIRQYGRQIFNKVKPDIIVLCGAENQDYSGLVLEAGDTPTVVIVETLLNDTNRKNLGIGNDYRRGLEKRIFQKCDYFITTIREWGSYIKSQNPNAQIVPIKFVSHEPVIIEDAEIKYDFVFFARSVSRQKGGIDLIQAMGLVCHKRPTATLNIIGSVDKNIKDEIEQTIREYSLDNNIHFQGFNKNIEDTYRQVQEAKIVVVPGITNTFNSTIREAMFMRRPTICYDNAAIREVNEVKTCLIPAEMGNVKDLAEKMIYALDHTEETTAIANNGYKYAQEKFSNNLIGNQIICFFNSLLQ